MKHGSFLGKDFKIDIKSISSENYKLIDGQYYFTIPYYESIFPITLKIDPFEMQLQISSEQELPLTKQFQNERRRQSFVPLPEPDTFKNYEFDNRKFSTPVLDLTYQNNYNISDYNGENEKRWDSNYYQADFGMLLGGMDTYGSIFGDSENEDYGPRARLTVGRTFLDEPRNALNLTTFEAGDVTGFNSTLFNNGANGRGAYASSFKDLVTSADKTIDINGPLSDGWDVELYLNDQLIGFRQAGINGRYQFSNVPVNYGLNAFKLVFYGPYGEVQTEERNYYSGTSPVKTGEFGYNINAYQKDHYLFEKNEPYINPSNKPTLDFTGYYGINDNMTLIGGITETADVVTDEAQKFGNAGMQLIFQGASFQYNSMYNFENTKLGHHFDVQGDVYIGNIFARYDYYGGIHSPISYYNDEYLKDLVEIRLSGYIPWASLPYYTSYQESNSEDGDKLQEARLRLSPNFMRYYNMTVEDIWQKDKFGTNNDALLLLQAQFDKLGLHSQARYRLSPDSYLHSLNQQIDYRWNKRTYFQANWERDCRSQYSDMGDLDTFSISAGRLFPIGGLTLTLSADTDKDANMFLTYNISFGKVPDEPRIFADAQSHMSERSAIFAKVVDETGKPMPGTRLSVTGLQEPVVTNEKGEVLINDLEPYQKTQLTVDTSSVEDIALVPEFETKKLVLRPGTVLPMTITFAHKAGLEGFISGNGNLYDYKIMLANSKGKVVASKTPEADGSFIFDDINYGKYEIWVVDTQKKVLKKEKITLNNDFHSLKNPIKI